MRRDQQRQHRRNADRDDQVGAVAKFADKSAPQHRPELRPLIVPPKSAAAFSATGAAGNADGASLRSETCLTSWIRRNASYLSRQNSGE